MEAATSVETMPVLISQSKNVSPASPDQSVPSQSKAATSGLRRRTESRKSKDASDMNCFVFRSQIAREIELKIRRSKDSRSKIKGGGRNRQVSRKSSVTMLRAWRNRPAC